MSHKKMLSLLFVLILTIFSCSTLIASESFSDQMITADRPFASDDLIFSQESNPDTVSNSSEMSDLFGNVLSSGLTETALIAKNDVSNISPTPRPAWMSIPIVAGDTDGVYMRVKTNKQTYAVGEIIYITVYVSGLDVDKDNEKEVLIRAEGYGIAPVALNAETVSGTASGIVAVVASRVKAVKLDIIVEYGDNQVLAGSIPLTFNSASIPTQTQSSNSQLTSINIELTDGGKKGGDLPKTSDVNPSSYAVGGLTFIVMVICTITISQLAQKRKSSRNTISSAMYDRGYIYGGRMDIYSKKEDSNEEQNS